MEERRKVLSKRLQMLARMVTPGSRVADVGCDHGFLSIHLVQEGISPKVIAMDVRRGPLSAAREHIDAYGLGTYIETRLSDGLRKLRPGEADTVICAGMGGRLMERILTESMEKALQLRELILQPQSEIQEFREFLRGARLRITQEDMVWEDGKYYFAMRAVPEIRGAVEEAAYPEVFPDTGLADTADYIRLCDIFGEKLLCARHPVLKQYLQQREKALEQLAESLAGQGTERADARRLEIRQELDDIHWALGQFYD